MATYAPNKKKKIPKHILGLIIYIHQTKTKPKHKMCCAMHRRRYNNKIIKKKQTELKTQ